MVALAVNAAKSTFIFFLSVRNGLNSTCHHGIKLAEVFSIILFYNFFLKMVIIMELSVTNTELSVIRNSVDQT